MIRDLLGFAAAAVPLLGLLLLAGQLAHVGPILVHADPAIWLRVAGLGALAMAEVVLPLAGLVACGLSYGRLRSEGGLVARAALGAGPLAVFGPALVVGGALGGAAALIARGPAPHAIAELRTVLMQAAADGVFGVATGRTLPLPGGGHVRRDGGTLWAALEDGRTLVRATDASVAVVPGGHAEVTLRDAWIWGPDARIRVGAATLRFDAHALSRKLGTFGPPNATPTAALDAADPHAAFVGWRRWVVAATAPLWAVLGALLGGALGGAWATLTGAGVVTITYWLLRTGELAARAGSVEPVLGALAPVLALLLLLAVLGPRLARPAD